MAAAITKQVTGRLKLDASSQMTDPLLTCQNIHIDVVNKTVMFDYVATNAANSAQIGRSTPALDYSAVTTAAIPAITHLNTVINTWVSANLV